MDHRKAGASTGFGITAPLRAMGVPLNRSGHNEQRPSTEVSQRRDSHPTPGEPNTMFAQNLVEGLSRRPV